MTRRLSIFAVLITACGPGLTTGSASSSEGGSEGSSASDTSQATGISETGGTVNCDPPDPTFYSGCGERVEYDGSCADGSCAVPGLDARVYGRFRERFKAHHGLREEQYVQRVLVRGAGILDLSQLVQFSITLNYAHCWIVSPRIDIRVTLGDAPLADLEVSDAEIDAAIDDELQFLGYQFPTSITTVDAVSDAMNGCDATLEWNGCDIQLGTELDLRVSRSTCESDNCVDSVVSLEDAETFCALADPETDFNCCQRIEADCGVGETGDTAC